MIARVVSTYGIIVLARGISEISLSLIDKHIKKAYQLVNRIYLPCLDKTLRSYFSNK